MGAVRMRLRAELRRRWASLIALIVLVGLGGAMVLAAAAAARRTDSAYPRFLEAARTSDFLISPEGTVLQGFAEEVTRLPEVVDHGLIAGFNVEVVDPAPPTDDLFVATAFAAADDRAMRTIDRPNVLAGRLPDPASATEIAINKPMADALGLEAGDSISVRISSDPAHSSGPFRLTVSGVVIGTSEVIPIARFDTFPVMTMTPAAFRRWRDTGLAFDGVIVRTLAGTDAAAFERTVRGIASRRPETGGEIFFADSRDRPQLVARALRPQVFALSAFAIVSGLTVLLVIAQVLGRQTVLEATEHPSLRALGMTRGQLVTISLLRAGLVSVVGIVLAVAGAFIASPVAPVGPARLAEPHPGFVFDAAVLGLGALAVFALVVGSVVPRAVRAARVRSTGTLGTAEPGQRRTSRIADLISRFGGSAPVATGLRFALEAGRGRSAVPVRSTIAGTLIATLAVAATFTFGSSLDHLVATPALYGQDWDLVFDVGFGSVPPEMLEQMRSDPEIEAVVAGGYALLTVDGRQVPAVGLDQLRGNAYPTLLEGRAARARDEIVLGSSTLERLERSLGDEVTVETPAATTRMRIVGRAVFPQLGQGSFTPTGLGQGAAVTVAALGPRPGAASEYPFAAMRLRDGADGAAVERRVTDRCRKLLQEEDDLCEIVTSQAPPDIANYARIRTTPLALAAVLGLLAAATLAHALTTSVLRRRRDLAVLRTIGFSRAQLFRTVAWQAGTLTIVALVIGLPLGVAVGHWIWEIFAGQLGVAARTTTPLATIASIAGSALVIALLVATLPARAASRTKPAFVLRTE